MYDVLLETLAAPPAAAAIESTIRIRFVFGGLPSLVEQAGLGADGRHRAHGVEEVGEQQREDQQHDGDEAGVLPRAEQVEVADQAEVRDVDDLVRERGHVEVPALGVDPVGGERRPDLGHLLDDDRDERGDTIEIRMAPLTCAHVERDHQDQPDREHEHGPACELATDAELDGDRTDSGAAYEPGVDEPDEGDEQADADRDGDLELGGYGVEDRLPEAGQDQHQDDQALDHDQPHRVGPRHLARDRERDERVEAEARRQRQWVVGDDPHQDRQHAGRQRRGRCDLCERADDVTVDVGALEKDDRVQDDDVGHRQERHDATADLTGHGRAALGDPEEAVEAAGGHVLGGRLVRHRSESGRTGLPPGFIEPGVEAGNVDAWS